MRQFLIGILGKAHPRNRKAHLSSHNKNRANFSKRNI